MPSSETEHSSHDDFSVNDRKRETVAVGKTGQRSGSKRKAGGCKRKC